MCLSQIARLNGIRLTLHHKTALPQAVYYCALVHLNQTDASDRAWIWTGQTFLLWLRLSESLPVSQLPCCRVHSMKLSSRTWTKSSAHARCECYRKYIHARVAFDNLEKTTKHLACSLCLATKRHSDASNKTTVSISTFISLRRNKYVKMTPQPEIESFLANPANVSMSQPWTCMSECSYWHTLLLYFYYLFYTVSVLISQCLTLWPALNVRTSISQLG